MSEFDTIIAEAGKEPEKKAQPKTVPIEISDKDKDKKSYGETMTEKRNACYAMVEDACIDVMSSAENMNRFLAVQSRFERYSMNNNLLIYMQMAEAVKVKDFEAWKKDEIFVKKGSKSFMILEPHMYTGSDGKQHRAYNAKSVFDISATNAPKEAYPEKKTYESKQLISALVHDSPVPVRRAEQPSFEGGAVYDADNKVIYFKQGMSFDEIFPAIAKALAHAEMAKGVEHYRTDDREFAARCAANIIAQKYGVSNSTVSIHSIPPKYASLGADEIKGEIGDIHNAVNTVTERMYSVLEKTADKEQSKSPKDSKDRAER